MGQLVSPSYRDSSRLNVQLFCGTAFRVGHLATILMASIIAGLILTFLSRDAAGSGIPQVKVAFWRDFGSMPAKVVIAKFFAGALSIGGGCSLEPEGPTFHVEGALASNIAGWLGIAKQGRRPALICGAADPLKVLRSRHKYEATS
jgi:CIC family chloride channel protein